MRYMDVLREMHGVGAEYIYNHSKGDKIHA